MSCKEGMQVLGYGNTFSQGNISKGSSGRTPFFKDSVMPQEIANAHTVLSLPMGTLDNKTFYKISEEYMESMGYGENRA